MGALFGKRRWVALLCLAVLLLAILAAGASGLPFALLAPLWVFFGPTPWLAERLLRLTCAPRRVSAHSHLITRAPPSVC